LLFSFPARLGAEKKRSLSAHVCVSEEIAKIKKQISKIGYRLRRYMLYELVKVAYVRIPACAGMTIY
jgi:hypothetical protein